MSHRALRLVPEVFLLGLVLAGLGNTIVRFVVDGKLPQPFIFDIFDTFMDWFNTAYYAHNSGAFDVWHTVYPPLSFVFLRLAGTPGCFTSSAVRARDCDVYGISVILVSYILCVFVAFIAFWRRDQRTAWMRGVAFGLGLPLLFTLERGNLILPCFVAFAIAHGDVVRSRLLRALAIGITINFKPYLLLPVLGSAIKRDWRMLEVAGIASVIIYAATYAFVASGSPGQLVENTLNWLAFTNGLIWEQIYYSTSYTPFLEFNTHRFPTRDFLPSALLDNVFFWIPILTRSSQVIGLLCIVGAWLQPQALTTKRAATLLLTTYLVGQSPGGYTMVFLVFLVFLEKFERPGPIIAIMMAYVLCIPYDYVFSNIIEMNGDSWLGQRSVMSAFGISAGIFIRPGVIIVLFWALALDSLTLIYTEHKRRPPVLWLGDLARPMLI